MLFRSTGVSWVAVRGSGVQRDNRTVKVAPWGEASGPFTGAVLTRFLSAEHNNLITEAGPKLGTILPGRVCAGVEYPLVVEGAQDFALFRRTLPWDHAAGSLILREAGGEVRRWDGSNYEPGIAGEGILAATNPAIWEKVAKALLP